MRTILLTVLISLLMFFELSAQVMPLVYDVENTGADCPKPPLPPFDALQNIQTLPDPFEWTDGRGRMKYFSDWRYRRAEISTEVQYYELGMKPDPSAPEDLEASFADGKLTVRIKKGADTLTLTAVITLPASGTGPFPAIIGVGGGTGSLPADLFTSKGIATIAYNFSEVAPWTQSGRGLGGFYKLFPDGNVGYFTAWAWGVSRIIDGLQKVPQTNIDTKHLAITGCSFAGKIALFSGALDERIALTITQEPGGGGDAAWRVTETLAGSRETLRNAQGYGWYSWDVRQFNNAVTKLPYDHHEVMALIAPRALFVLGNPDYEWLSDESGYVACKAAHEVWKALKVPDRFGFSKIGGHSHCQLPDSERPEAGAFIDKFLLGKDTTNTNIATQPGYTTNLAQWITWATPNLTDGTSYWGRSSLIYPPNLQIGMQSDITFKWNKVKDIQKYYFQLSADASFNTAAVNDSTTDTVKAVTGLLKATKYYWRVRVKNTDGIFGPWTELWSFSTFAPLPAAPQLVKATTRYPTRSDYITMKWRKVENADQYLFQLSDTLNFVNIILGSNTTDTVKNYNLAIEGKKYYWRVQASNIGGTSPWSESSFTIILAPQNLAVQKSADKEITLTWEDYSKVEDGYIIERKQESQTSFTILDTLKGSGIQYIDKKVDPAQNYIYRVKTYKGSAASDYSNEASITTVGVKEEEAMPAEYSLSQNYPNPFNPATKIKFALPNASLTKITVYDLLGREVRTLLNKELEAGYHEVTLKAENFQSGIYYYRIQSGNFTNTKKMILMK